MKIYSLSRDGKTKLSPHFQVYEFASTSPSPYNYNTIYTDTVLIDEELLEKLETLFSLLCATKCKISSGYRTVDHDKAVGGNGQGQHTKGNAVDCCFYKNNKVIDSRIVSIFAQTVGFNGIARISNNYTHLDTRKNSRYMGDETKSNNSVCSDFLEYYNFLN